MGVAFSHCNAHWAYGGFNQFRHRLAREIGMDLDSMVGYGGAIPWDNVTDLIAPLLNHSDCEGELSPEVCATIAPRLRQLVANWEDCFDKDRALELASGMEAAAAAGELLEFY